MKIKKCGYIILDISIVIASIVIASLLRFEFQIPTIYYSMIIDFIPIAMISTIILSILFGSYNSVLTYFGFSEILKQCLVAFFVGCLFLVIKLAEIINISGSITIIYCGTFFALSSCVRSLPRCQRWLLSLKAVRLGKSKKVLIIGAGKAGAMVVKQLIDSDDDAFFPIGILDDDVNKHNKKVAGIKVLGKIENSAYFANKLNADEILIAIPSANDVELREIFDRVSNANIPTKIFQNTIDIQKYQEGDKNALKEITIEDLLFRDAIKTDNSLNKSLIEGKVVLVTGGAGSIGSELCRQILENKPKKLIIFDIHENGLFDINEEFKNIYPNKYITCLGSVRDANRVKMIFDTYNPNIVFHAAAHKHVPMMEINPFEAVKNNILGTLNVIEETVAHKCQKFILISTDKAVNPTNVMGATKRGCELLVKSYSNDTTEMVAVRFGNVLGSNGSVIPVFKKQIASGGPVTVTHKDMTRYFMTIKEAVSLVLSAGASAKGSELFVLDMGQPIKIYDLAVNLVRLSGRVPFKDIDIKVTGLRDGEKLYEELVLTNETVDNTSHKKIFIVRDNGVDKKQIRDNVNALIDIVTEQKDEEKLRETLFNMIKEEVLV